jgi:hypothetical protein
MTRSTILCTVTAILAGMGTVGWAEDSVSVGVAADLFSKYIWRGQNLVDDWVLQPSASVGYQGFTGSVWGNMDLTGDAVGSGQFNEVDLSLDYSNTVPGLDKLGYSVGAIYYNFPNTGGPATAEVYGGLSLDVPLSPAVRWYYDFDEIEGSYIQLSLGHTLEKIWGWRDDCYCDLQLGASLGYGTAGYNDGYFGVDDGAVNDLTLTAGLPICLGKLTIRPSVGYSIMIDDDIRAATGKSDNFWGGVGFAYNF